MEFWKGQVCSMNQADDWDKFTLRVCKLADSLGESGGGGELLFMHLAWQIHSNFN